MSKSRSACAGNSTPETAQDAPAPSVAWRTSNGSDAEATLTFAHGIEDLLSIHKLPDLKTIQTACNLCN
jgi:hypothetical protein